jgi:hypothetical protein
MTIVPLRSTAWGLLATLNDTCASPWPLAGEMAIQSTSGLADHVHSRLIASARVPEPPPLSIIGGVPETVSAHRAGVGAAAFDVDEELHAAGSRPLSITTIVVKRESLTIAFERNNQ